MFIAATLLIFVSCAAAKPVVFLSYAGEESKEAFLDCFNPETEFDSSTGYITYRCRPVVTEVNEEIFDKKPLLDVNNLELISNEIDGNPSKQSFEDIVIVEESSDDDDEDQIIYEVVSIEAGKPILQNDSSKKQRTSQIKDQDKKKDNECKYNCCPEGQMYQSELDICIDYNPGSPRPAVSSSEEIKYEATKSSPERKPSTIYITDSQEEKPQADSPQTKPQKNNPQSTILSVGKFDLKHRCHDDEFYLSELDICVSLDK